MSLRIFQVLSNFLPQHIAGTEVYTWALSRQLQKMGIDIKVVIPNYARKENASYEYDGLKVYQYAETSVVDRNLIMGFRSADGLPNFISYIKDLKPDIVHFHQISGSNGITLRHLQAAKATGAKVVMTFHLAGYSCKTGTLFYKGEKICDGVIDLKKCSICYLHSRGYIKSAPYITGTSFLLHKLSIDTSILNHKLGTMFSIAPLLYRYKEDLLSLANYCDQVVTIAKWYERVLIANGFPQERISFISQGLPFENEYLEEKYRSVQSPLRLLFLGRISKYKGLHLLIEALQGIDPKIVELYIYGSSDNTPYEKELRANTNSNINIYWKGNVSQHEVITTMQQHDVLCLCSTSSEMSPLVIQEAFKAQLPIIASNVYGNAEQIQHGYNGLLFNFNDVNSLRTQIINCLKDRLLLLRMAKNIKPPLDFAEVAGAYHQLYQNILSDS